MYQDPLSGTQIIADNQAIYNELDQQYDPLDSTGNPFRRTLKVWDVSVWVSDAIWMPTMSTYGSVSEYDCELWYLQMFDHHNHGGDTRLDAVWANLRGKEHSMGALTEPNWQYEVPYVEAPSYYMTSRERYQYSSQAMSKKEKEWRSKERAIHVWLNRDVLTNGGGFYLKRDRSAQTDPPITTFLIRPKMAKVGDTSQNFPFFIPKTFTHKQRNWAFFQQLRYRLQLPFLYEWTGALWDDMLNFTGQNKMITPMKNFGTVEGYWIRLSQQWIAEWQTRQVKYGAFAKAA